MTSHLSQDIDWMLDGLCREIDPEIFYPEHGPDVAVAKDVCRVCDVREDCLSYALATEEPFGVWGGLSTRQRNRILRGGRVDVDPPALELVAELDLVQELELDVVAQELELEDGAA
jgi:WhiB family redox-sensing transcriptional regulator